MNVTALRRGLGLLPVILTAACATPGEAPAVLATAAPSALVLVEAIAPPPPDPVTTWRLPTSNGAFYLEIVPVPDPVAVRQHFRLRLTVYDADGQPDPGARVQLNAWMPEHGHGMARRPRVRSLGGGEYLAEGLLFTMRGHWELIVSVFSGTRSGQAQLALEV